MKKFLAVLSAFCVLSSSAYAANISSVVVSDFDNSIITVSGTVSAGEDNVAVTILPKGTSLANGNTYTKDSTTIQEATVSNGTFTATFLFKPENGTYTAVASGSDAYDFEYISKEDVLQFVDDLGNKLYSGSGLYTKLKYYAMSAGFDLSFVENSTDEDYVSHNVVLYASKIKSEGLSGAKAVVEQTKNETLFMKQLKVSQTYSTVDNLLNAYTTSANIDLSSYKKLSNSQKRTVDLGLVGKSYTDIEDFKTAFTKLIKSASASSNTSSGGGGGGGGGGATASGTHTGASPSTNDYAQDLAGGSKLTLPNDLASWLLEAFSTSNQASVIEKLIGLVK